MTAASVTRDLIVAQTRALKLPGVARVFESLARQAREAHWPHEDYLHEAVTAEQASRHDSVIRQRLREARFPEIKTLDSFDFTAADGISATEIHGLARGEWVTAPENLIFAGPIGTGKTHLAIALGVEATKQKRRVLFTRAADLVRQLLEARDARELTRLQQRLLRVDALIIDEVGFVPFDRVGGELLFNLITDRYERRATVVTTNLAFAEWVTVFAGDEKLTTALLDRLAHHATVITTKGKSYRMRKRRGTAACARSPATSTAPAAPGPTIVSAPRVCSPNSEPEEVIAKRRGCGNDAAMEITNRFPPPLGNLAQNVRFPHSHKPIPFSLTREERRISRPQTGSLSERRTGLLSERRLQQQLTVGQVEYQCAQILDAEPQLIPGFDAVLIAQSLRVSRQDIKPHPESSTCGTPSTILSARSGGCFAKAATNDAAFACELPRFLAAIWRVFNEYELAGYVACQKPAVRRELRALLYLP
jgi:DNA replication protein DnaC